jgi:hypothetical protein
MRLMISSRSDRFSLADSAGESKTLRAARLLLKEEIEAETFLGKGLVDVWINEAAVGSHDQTAWDECITQAEESDLFLSLFDGTSGWTPAGGSVGICHAEFGKAARNFQPATEEDWRINQRSGYLGTLQPNAKRDRRRRFDRRRRTQSK